VTGPRLQSRGPACVCIGFCWVRDPHSSRIDEPVATGPLPQTEPMLVPVI
jgi:hypothetical protein